MHIRTIADMNHTIIRNLWQVPSDIDVVAGVPRSGLLAANMLALHLNLPLTDIDGLVEGRLLGTGKRPLRGTEQELPALDRPRHVLIVDDCVSLGTELRKIRSRLVQSDIPHRLTYLCVYAFPEGATEPDVVMERVPRPMVFEWSFLHSTALDQVCLDIDGVICVDPTNDEDDDGEQYTRFLTDARPLFLPTAEARALVTSRLERYRPQTEEWLRRHGVRYRELIMMDYPTADARRRANQQAAFKAEAMRRTGAKLFVESNPGLARQIAQISGRPVLSLTTNEVMHASLRLRLTLAMQRGRWFLRRLKRAPAKIVRVVRQRLS